MKKHLTTLAAAMLLMSCGGNGSSSEAEASSPKSLEIPNDINTPYSISDLPIDKTDVVAITLDNDARAHTNRLTNPSVSMPKELSLHCHQITGVDQSENGMVL